MSTYTIMLKDTPVGSLDIVRDTVYNIKLSKELYKIYNNPEPFIIGRINIANRHNILDLCKLNALDSLEEYANVTKCISLTDSLWLNNNEDKTDFSKINAYENPISSILADCAIDGIKYLHGQRLREPSPQYNIPGSTDKCIKRVHTKNQKDNLYLYKSIGTIEVETGFVRPYSEYFAYQVAQQLDIETVEYNIKEKTSDNGYIKPYCICKLFTNKDTSLVDYGDSIYSNLNILKLIKHLEGTNKTQDAKTLREMLILDSIILNCDRHSGNYGFLVDNNTLIYKSVAPIFDNDCSLASLEPVMGYTPEQVYNRAIHRLPKTEFKDYNEQALACMNKQIFNKLQSIDKIKITRGKAKSISDERIDTMEYIVNRRIKEILQFVKEVNHLY